jgi:membrane protein involved in colicin uptake
VLKRQLSKQLSAAWLEALGALGGEEEDETNGDAEEEANGNAETEAEEESAEGEADQKAEVEKPAEKDTEQKVKAKAEKQDLLVQWLMDISYLGLFLGSDDTLRELEQAVSKESGLETAAKERLAKASQDYFKRTSLLFGLLA